LSPKGEKPLKKGVLVLGKIRWRDGGSSARKITSKRRGGDLAVRTKHLYRTHRWRSSFGEREGGWRGRETIYL